MKNFNFSGICKTSIPLKIMELCAKAKRSIRSYWVQNKPIFKKHGDKLLFALALAVLAAALINSFGKKVITQAGAPTIVFTQWWQNDLEKDALAALIAEFEELHNDIKIVINDISYEDLRQKLFDPQEGGFPGDVLALDPLWIPELLKNETIEITWEESPLKQGLDSPLLSFINLLYYNVEILTEAGFTRPPKTRTEFIAYTAELGKNQDKNRGLAIDRNSSRGIYDDVFPWIWSGGLHLVNDGKPVINSRALVESLSFLASLYKEGFLVPDDKLEDFISGRAAFMIAPANYIAHVRERMDDETFGISTVPSPDNYMGKIISASAAWTIGVHADSSHKEEARLFTAFLAGSAALLSKTANAVPGNSATPPPPDVFYSKAWDIASSGELAHDFSGLPWMELEEAFKTEFDLLLDDQTSPSECAAAIQKKWEAILEDFAKE